MRRNAILITILVAELGVAALAVVFYLQARPRILGAFGEFATPLPAPARLALAPWFLPGGLLTAALLTALAILLPLRRASRPLLAGAGLVILAFALMFAVLAAFMPIFQPA